jgi:class 3 adenylate cyclase
MNNFALAEHLHIGAGIATREAFVGNVGEGAVTDYTVLGDTVNVAARL